MKQQYRLYDDEVSNDIPDRTEFNPREEDNMPFKLKVLKWLEGLDAPQFSYTNAIQGFNYIVQNPYPGTLSDTVSNYSGSQGHEEKQWRENTKKTLEEYRYEPEMSIPFDSTTKINTNNNNETFATDTTTEFRELVISSNNTPKARSPTNKHSPKRKLLQHNTSHTRMKRKPVNTGLHSRQTGQPSPISTANPKNYRTSVKSPPFGFQTLDSPQTPFVFPAIPNLPFNNNNNTIIQQKQQQQQPLSPSYSSESTPISPQNLNHRYSSIPQPSPPPPYTSRVSPSPIVNANMNHLQAPPVPARPQRHHYRSYQRHPYPTRNNPSIDKIKKTGY